MGWIYLLFAIILEVAGTTFMKLSDGFTRPIPSIGLFICYGLCFTFFSIALKQIPVSVAYAIWAGVGTVLVSSIGIIWFKESAELSKLISIGLIVIGVIGINLRGGSD